MDAWITNSLINFTDHGHSYANFLTEAAIVGFNGTVLAHTAGLDVKQDEFKKLTEFFKKALTLHQSCWEARSIKLGKERNSHKVLVCSIRLLKILLHNSNK